MIAAASDDVHVEFILLFFFNQCGRYSIPNVSEKKKIRFVALNV